MKAKQLSSRQLSFANQARGSVRRVHKPYALHDILLRNEVILYGKKKLSMSTEQIVQTILQFLDLHYRIGNDRTPKLFAANFMCLSKSFYKLAINNLTLSRHLILRSPSPANQVFLTRLLKLHPENILTLDFSFCYRYLKDAQLETIVAKCPSLATLIVWGCHDLTDASLDSIANSSLDLRYLNCGGCIHLTDKGIYNLSMQLLHLEVLNVSGCGRLTDHAFRYYYQTFPVVMVIPEEILADEKEPELTSADLQMMSRQEQKYGLRNLKHRRLEGSQELILEFAARPKAVERWIDATSMTKYKPHLRSLTGRVYCGTFSCLMLKVLNCLHCPQVTEEWLDRINRMYPGIHVIQ